MTRAVKGSQATSRRTTTPSNGSSSSSGCRASSSFGSPAPSRRSFADQSQGDEARLGGIAFAGAAASMVIYFVGLSCWTTMAHLFGGYGGNQFTEAALGDALTLFNLADVALAMAGFTAVIFVGASSARFYARPWSPIGLRGPEERLRCFFSSTHPLYRWRLGVARRLPRHGCVPSVPRMGVRSKCAARSKREPRELRSKRGDCGALAGPGVPGCTSPSAGVG